MCMIQKWQKRDAAGAVPINRKEKKLLLIIVAVAIDKTMQSVPLLLILVHVTMHAK